MQCGTAGIQVDLNNRIIQSYKVSDEKNHSRGCEGILLTSKTAKINLTAVLNLELVHDRNFHHQRGSIVGTYRPRSQ